LRASRSNGESGPASASQTWALPEAPPEALERHAPNVLSALAELRAKHQVDPRLSSGRKVEFKEFVKACLRTTLIEIDRAQRPELYRGDNHTYDHTRDEVLEGNDEELFKARHGDVDHVGPRRRSHRSEVERGEAVDPTAEAALDRLEPTQPRDPLDSLIRGLTSARISAASHPGVLRLLEGVREKDIKNGRQARKALGHSDYNTHAATAPLHDAEEACRGWRPGRMAGLGEVHPLIARLSRGLSRARP
jgi:hypothetical protein